MPSLGSPAHAGIDLSEGFDAPGCSGFPRTRGDRPLTRLVEQGQELVPPHTRG